jgi:hypothetical protein
VLRSARPRDRAQDCIASRSHARHGQARFGRLDYNQLELTQSSKLQAVRLDPPWCILHHHQRGKFVGTQHDIPSRLEVEKDPPYTAAEAFWSSLSIAY